jgi:hypothetical protein
VTRWKIGAEAWLVRCVRPKPWIALSARQPALDEVMRTTGVRRFPTTNRGMIAAPGACPPRENTRIGFLAALEGVGFGEVGVARNGPRSTLRISPLLVGLADDPLFAAGDLGHLVGAKMVHQHFQRAVGNPDAAQFDRSARSLHRQGFRGCAPGCPPLSTTGRLRACCRCRRRTPPYCIDRKRFVDHLHQLIARRHVEVFEVAFARTAGALAMRALLRRLVRVDQLQDGLACPPSGQLSMPFRTDGICIEVMIWLKNRWCDAPEGTTAPPCAGACRCNRVCRRLRRARRS